MSGTSTANLTPEALLLSFLNAHHQGEKLCLALSGGPDSMALFHLLLKTKANFCVAHVNHSVRLASDKEQEAIQTLCKEHSIDCFIQKNSPEDYSGNFENSARELRYQFFYSLFKNKHFSALLLGHQMDDQAETTLKRIFEGAQLTSLSSIKEISTWQEMPLWRPFLKIQKRSLVSWLDQQNIPYFIDHTNFDPKYTRSRMRQQLIPTLESEFGKGIVNPLNRLSEYAGDLSDFLDQQINPLLKEVKQDNSIDLSYYPSLHRVVFIHLMRRALHPHILTQRQCNELYQSYQKGAPHKKWSVGDVTIHMDRGRLRLMI